MLNVFYWYSIIWGSVLFLYYLGFSYYNTRLEKSLLTFILVSIIISFILGKINKKNFKYTTSSSFHKRTKVLTLVTCIIGALEFLYAKDIPLFFIALGKSKYGDFQGIPLIHTLLENFIIFYSSYLFYLYLESNNKSLLFECCALISILLLMFHKGATLFCLFIMFNLKLAKIKLQGKITIKRIILLIVVIFLIIYINGGLSNIRSGYAWNDCSFIFKIGGIKYWPSILPKELSWAYVYITSPLANLNLMIKKYSDVFSLNKMFFTIIPVFITKRLFPEYLIDSKSTYILCHSALNACTGFAEPVVAASNLGLWFYFISFIFFIILTIKIIKKDEYSTAFYAILSMLISFLFFYNTLTTAATSFLIIYIWLYVIIKKIRM